MAIVNVSSARNAMKAVSCMKRATITAILFAKNAVFAHHFSISHRPALKVPTPRVPRALSVMTHSSKLQNVVTAAILNVKA